MFLEKKSAISETFFYPSTKIVVFTKNTQLEKKIFVYYSIEDVVPLPDFLEGGFFLLSYRGGKEGRITFCDKRCCLVFSCISSKWERRRLERR